MELEREMRSLSEKMNGITAAMESGFVGLRKDVQYMSTYGKPALILAAVAALLGALSLLFALDNRNMIMQNAVETAKNTRDIENMLPVIMAPATPPHSGE